MKFFKKKNKIVLDRTVFDKYYNRIYQTAYFITRDRYIAQDVVQETFIKAINKINTLDDVDKIGAWLSSICARTAIDVLRKEKRWSYEEYLDTDYNLQPSTEKIVELNFLDNVLKLEIEELDPIYRQVLIFKYEIGLNYDEIAIALDINVGTVKSRLYRAKEKLRETLKDKHEINEGDL